MGPSYHRALCVLLRNMDITLRHQGAKEGYRQEAEGSAYELEAF